MEWHDDWVSVSCKNETEEKCVRDRPRLLIANKRAPAKELTKKQKKERVGKVTEVDKMFAAAFGLELKKTEAGKRSAPLESQPLRQSQRDRKKPKELLSQNYASHEDSDESGRVVDITSDEMEESIIMHLVQKRCFFCS